MTGIHTGNGAGRTAGRDDLTSSAFSGDGPPRLADSARTVPMRDQPTSAPRRLAFRQFLAVAAGVVLFAVAVIRVVATIDYHMGILLLLVTTTGAAGGLLFAMREGEVELPRLAGNSVRPGWISDALFGIAGAHSIFLLIPNFSENAIKSALEWTTPGQQSSDGAGADILEVVAVGLVAGFAGRSVLKRATDGLLKEKLQHVEDVQEEQRKELAATRLRLAEAVADSDAIALTVSQMNSVLSSPEREKLRQAIGRSSPNGRTRIFDVVKTTYQSDPDKKGVSARALPVLDWLLEIDNFRLEHKAYALVGEIYSAGGRHERAMEMYEKALGAMPGDGEREEFAGLYQKRLFELKEARRAPASSLTGSKPA